MHSKSKSLRKTVVMIVLLCMAACIITLGIAPATARAAENEEKQELNLVKTEKETTDWFQEADEKVFAAEDITAMNAYAPNSTSLITIKKGTPLTVNGIDEEHDLYRINYQGAFYFIENGDNLVRSDKMVFSDTKLTRYVSVDTLPAYESLETFQSNWYLHYNDRVNIIGTNELYYKAMDADHGVYYINRDNTMAEEHDFFEDVEDNVYVTKNSVNVRTGPGTEYLSTVKVGYGDKLDRTGIGEGEWDEVLIDGETMYIHKDYISEKKPASKARRSSSSSSSSSASASAPAEGDATATTEGEYIAKDGTVHKAKVTAYYPSNSGIEGGYYDARGNRLDPSKNTCAAPKSVPLGSKVTIDGTGTWMDGQTYTVTDRGGGVKVEGDGTYHIDILMGSRDEVNDWGRRHATITIEE